MKKPYHVCGRLSRKITNPVEKQERNSLFSTGLVIWIPLSDRARPMAAAAAGICQTMDSRRFLAVRSSSSIRAWFSGVARNVGMDMPRAKAGFPSL